LTVPVKATGRGYFKNASRIVVVGLVLVTQFQARAIACTLCHSRIAEDVRAAVFGADFWSNLGALFLPVPILLVTVLLVRKISP
jgi:hypothetical protein